MYEAFYNLDTTPFRLSPDQRFCFPHQSYANTKAYVSYALQQAEGFVMVTGGPGTGKTTLINDVIADLNTEQVVVGRLVSSELPAEDFLRTVAFAFGLDPVEKDKASVLRDLEHFLIGQGRNGRSAVLIIDQAHELSPGSLNEIATLANMQSGGPSSLQVILLGQEQLHEVLHSPSMEQLLQRFIAVRHLDPLQIDETKPYIEHRLREVGWKGDPTFEDDVFPVVHEFSRGVPRRLNLICSRLLLCGSLDETHTLDGEDVRVAIEWLHKEMLTPPDRAATAQSESSPPAAAESKPAIEPPSANQRHEIKRPQTGDQEFDLASLAGPSLGPNSREKTSKEVPSARSESESRSGSMWTLTAEFDASDDPATQSADKNTHAAAIDHIVATRPVYRDHARLKSRRKDPLINRFLVAALGLVLALAAIYAINSGVFHFWGLNSEPVTNLTEEQPQQRASVEDNATPLIESEDETLGITDQGTVDVEWHEGPQSLTERHDSEAEPLSGLELAAITPAQTLDPNAPTERAPDAEVSTTQALPLKSELSSDSLIGLSMVEHSAEESSDGEMSAQDSDPVLAGIPEQDVSVLEVSESNVAILDIQEREAVILDVSEPHVPIRGVNDFNAVTPSAPKIDMVARSVSENHVAVLDVLEHDTLKLNASELDAAVVTISEHDTLTLHIRDYDAAVAKVSELDIALLDFSEQSDEGAEFGVLEATQQTVETATQPPRGIESTYSESVSEGRPGGLAMEERAPLQTELTTALLDSSDEGAIEIEITAVDLETPLQQHDEAELEAAREQEALIQSLLAQAENDLEALRLTTPVGNNALERYEAVQELQPDHPRARQGVEQIVARYAQLAQRSIIDGQFAAAEEFLRRADSVAPNSDITHTVREQMVNNGVAYAEETDRSIPEERSGALKVAIFPFESSETCSWPVDRGILDIATDLVRNNPSLVLTYSFYADSVQKQVIGETADVWEADLTRKGPIVDTVYDLGEELGVDGVLMSWIECSPNSEKYEEWYPVEVYLFDPEQRQLYYNKDLLSNLRTGTRKVFFEFINDRTGQIRTP